jgi:hypothetical protein
MSALLQTVARGVAEEVQTSALLDENFAFDAIGENDLMAWQKHVDIMDFPRMGDRRILTCRSIRRDQNFVGVEQRLRPRAPDHHTVIGLTSRPASGHIIVQ